jgi:hypothetical protein
VTSAATIEGGAIGRMQRLWMLPGAVHTLAGTGRRERVRLQAVVERATAVHDAPTQQGHRAGIQFSFSKAKRGATRTKAASYLALSPTLPASRCSAPLHAHTHACSLSLAAPRPSIKYSAT